MTHNGKKARKAAAARSRYTITKRDEQTKPTGNSKYAQKVRAR